MLKKYYKDNPDTKKKYQKKYNAEHKEQILIYNKKRDVSEHRKKYMREYMRKYNEKKKVV